MEIVGSSDSGAGLTGTSSSGTGVVGRGIGDTGVRGTGGLVGVHGSSTRGLGGDFSGGLAPLRLQPADTQGSPTSGTHSTGEFYVDNQGALYFCIANGTPGTWKRVQLV